MPDRHKKSDETPAWWLTKQIEPAKEVYREAQKLHYRRQLHGALDLVLPVVTGPVAQDDTALGREDDSGESVQIDINYIQRYVRWVEAQAFDQHPEIRYPRFATPDTSTGDMIAELLKRVGDEAREMDEWRMTIADACAMGVFAVWYGIQNDTTDEEALHYAMMSEQEIISLAEQGVHQAFHGQDHAKMAVVFQNLAMGDPADEESVDEAVARSLMPGGELLKERFLIAAMAHEQAFEKESKEPSPIRFAENEVWVQRRPIGESTLWDPEADNIRDARWVARRFIEDIDSVKKNPVYKKGIRSRVEAGQWAKREGFYRGNPDDKKMPATKVAIWEIWDKKYRERHYVVDQKDFDSFLEVNPSNPYVDQLGRPILKDFFPVVIEAPIKAPSLQPTTPYGIPICASAWPLQKAAIQFLSHNMDAVKKLSAATWTYDDALDESVLQKLQSGQIGQGIPRSGVDPNSTRDIVEPVNWPNPSPEMFQQFAVAENKIAMMLAWPISQMTGQPIADTATAEQISVTAGNEQLGDFIRTMENAYARGQEIKAQLIKRFYSDEKVAELVGPEFVTTTEEGPGLYPLWRSSSQKGDRIQATFQSRIVGESLARKKQVGDVLMAAMQVTDPLTGLPLVSPPDIFRIFQEWVRLHGLGKVNRAEYTDEMLMSFTQAGMMGGGGKPSGNGSTGSGGHKKTGDKERSKKPASEQQMHAAAAKAGPSGGAGRGMEPQ